MEKIAYSGWPNCLLVKGKGCRLIVTTDVGPRIIHYSRNDSINILGEFKDQSGHTGGSEWRIYGGHRLWHAPESVPRSYAPDNDPVEYSFEDGTLFLSQATEATTGLQKEIDVHIDSESGEVSLHHRIWNRSAWPVEYAVWCLTVMTQGGRGIYPQEPYVSHKEQVTPARRMALWPYTNMADPRFTWGQRYVQLRQDPQAGTPQKFGILNGQGWVAYAHSNLLFIKAYAVDPAASHPHLGVNTESYTDGDILELETAGALQQVEPGECARHYERWGLYECSVSEDEDEIEAKVALPARELVQRLHTDLSTRWHSN